MPLKLQTNNWSIPHPTGMQHCICNRQEEAGIISQQTQVSSSYRGRMQAPNLAWELITALRSSLPPAALPTSSREGDRGQEFLTMGKHWAAGKCQHLGTLATEGIKSSHTPKAIGNCYYSHLVSPAMDSCVFWETLRNIWAYPAWRCLHRVRGEHSSRQSVWSRSLTTPSEEGTAF